MKRKNFLTRLSIWLSFSLLAAPATHSAEGGSATGTIEGRVLNARSGEYLERVRLTVAGTAIETFSDADGRFRLHNVPPGPANVTAFYTGLPAKSQSVVVRAGETVRQDIQLLGQAGDGAAHDPGVVKLDAFVVGTSKEMDAAAYAINEQRFAPNMKNVVSTDEFGSVAEGNVAEFMKFMPGLNVDHSGGNMRYISLNGVPSDNVPVTIDGFSLASVGGEVNTGRAVQIDLVSLNNLARIEVSHSPTPESQGAALAGSVNMVPRSAFERSKPSFKGSFYLMMRDQALDWHETPGPIKPTRKIRPGFDFNYVHPVNERFGYTLSGGNSTQYSPQDFAVNTWRGGAGTATNGVAFPNTTFDRPYLGAYALQDNPKITQRWAGGVTFDYRLTPRDRLAFGLQYSSFEVWYGMNTLTFNVNRVRPDGFSPTATRGEAGAGSLSLSNGERHRINRTYMPTLVWRHSGPVWNGEMGAGYSNALDRDDDAGSFRSTTAQRSGVTVSFDQVGRLRPEIITITDAAGAPLDPYSLGTYVMTAAQLAGNVRSDTKRTFYANMRRGFQGRVPFEVRVGVDARHSVRDTRLNSTPLSFVGADGRSSTTPLGNDDGAAPFLDESFSQRVPEFGVAPVQVPNAKKLYAYYEANPRAFTTNLNTEYRNGVSGSKLADELVSAAYFRGDLALFENRVKVVGGLRAEQTNVKGEGPLTDPTRNIQRNSAGAPILGSNGVPLAITTVALEASRLTFLEREAKANKEYLRLFPSVNVSYNVRENVIARAARYYTVGRPDFNQYVGGLTLPNTDLPPGAGNRIVVNNPGIKPWKANTTSVRLEYYFAGVGQISAGAFQRDFANFFGDTFFDVTPEFLALHGLDPAIYDAYEVSTQHNIDSGVRMRGFDINYRQALTFLPHWARGVQVFGNMSSLRATGDATANFSGFVPRTYNSGISLTREKFNARVNWNHVSRQPQQLVAQGLSIEPDARSYRAARDSVDLSGECNLTRQLSLYANFRTIGGQVQDLERYGSSTPAHARLQRRISYGSLWTFGLRGNF